MAICVVVAIAAGIGWFAFSLFQPFKDEAEGQAVSLKSPRERAWGGSPTSSKPKG